MATITAAAGGGKWSATSTWTGGVVPTAADDVVLGAGSGSVTIDAEAKCRSLNCSGYAGTLKHEAFKLLIGDATAGASNIALKFVAGMTYTTTNATASKIEFVSTSATQQTVDWAGKTTASVTFNGLAGSWKYLSAHSTGTGGVFTHQRGSLDINGQTCNWGKFEGNFGTTRSLTLGAATISITGTGGSWNFTNTTSLTFSGAEATIRFTDTGTTDKQFIGGGQSFGTVEAVGGGSGKFKLGEFGNNTIAKLVIGRPKTVVLGKEKTQTIGKLEATGAAGELIALESSEAGKAATIKITSGIVSCDYLRLKDIHAEGGAKFFAGAHSENVSGNEGWSFTPPESLPAGSTGSAAVLLARTLEGSVNPEGAETEYWFEIGPTTAYGTKVAGGVLGAGYAAIPVSANVSGLTQGTTYHFRLSMKNKVGETHGAHQSFLATSGASISVIE
jgi:hypothetical protein